MSKNNGLIFMNNLFNDHCVESQFFVDNHKSFIGGLIGLLIQPAQLKKILPHDTKDSLKERTNRKIEKIEKKLSDPTSQFRLHHKWNAKKIQYQKVLDSLENCHHQYFQITTKEGRVLDAVHISPKNNHSENQYYNVHLLGSSQRIGNRMFELYREADRQRVNVIAFDYSNVGFSKSKCGRISSLNQMLADASAVVNTLLEKGVPPSHITLHGFSIGGMLGTRLAAYCHQINLSVNLYTSCAPMELSPCVVHVLQKETSCITNILERCLGSLLKYFKWDFNAIEYWDSIPKASKEYSYIDIQNKSIHVSDNFIPISTTIHGKHLEQRLPSSEDHRFYLLKDDKAKNRHGTHQYLLSDSNQKTPEDLFDKFISRVYQRS